MPICSERCRQSFHYHHFVTDLRERREVVFTYMKYNMPMNIQEQWVINLVKQAEHVFTVAEDNSGRMNSVFRQRGFGACCCHSVCLINCQKQNSSIVYQHAFPGNREAWSSVNGCCIPVLLLIRVYALYALDRKILYLFATMCAVMAAISIVRIIQLKKRNRRAETKNI